MNRSNAIEYAFNIWDWTIAWEDFELYRRTVVQLRDLGFTKVELGVPWRNSAGKGGRLDLGETDRRIDLASDHGLAVRLRINAQDPPEGLSMTPSLLPDGTPFDKGYGSSHALPSLFERSNVRHQREWVSGVAAHYRGRGLEFSLGIGLHFELKFGGWNTYESAARQAFANFLSETDAGSQADASLLPVPQHTAAAADGWRVSVDGSSAAWIRLREQRLNEVVADLHRAIRENDPTAEISAPLGESFRAESAEFANQDIVGLSRTADNVVFSFDFFIHPPDAIEIVEEVVASYLDICGKPVRLELDGVAVGTYQRFGDDGQVEAAAAAIRGGATGINVANFSQERRWVENLSQFPFLARIGTLVRANRPVRPPTPRAAVYLSKWTHYAYREPSEWVHWAQFGMLRAVRATRPVKVVTDENLATLELDPATPLIIPWAPVIEAPAAARLLALVRRQPSLRDMRTGEVCVGPTITSWGDLFDRAFDATEGDAMSRLETIELTTGLMGLPAGRYRVRSGDDQCLPAATYSGAGWATNGALNHQYLVAGSNPRRMSLGFVLGLDPGARASSAALIGGLLDWLDGSIS